MRRSFNGVGMKKYKGTNYTNCFFGNELIAWTAAEEKITVARAKDLCDQLLTSGVIKPIEQKRTQVLDKQIPYRFVWNDYEQRIHCLRDIARHPSARFIIHIVGHKASREFKAARKTLQKLKEEFELAYEDRFSVWEFSVDDLALYRDWMSGKRLSLDAVTASAKYHEADHLIWVSFETTDYYIGDYNDLLDLFHEAHLLDGQALKKATKASKYKTASVVHL